MHGHYFFAEGVESDLPDARRVFQVSTAERVRLAALRHTPIERFAPGMRVEVTCPTGQHRPLAGRTGAVILLNESGSAWVRVADHCFAPGECSREVES